MRKRQTITAPLSSPLAALIHARTHSPMQVYKGPDHPHDAQSPEPLTFGGLTVSPDSRLLEFIDPDAPTCADIAA